MSSLDRKGVKMKLKESGRHKKGDRSCVLGDIVLAYSRLLKEQLFIDLSGFSAKGP